MKRAVSYIRAALLGLVFTLTLAAQPTAAGPPEALGREVAKEHGHQTNIAQWKLANFVLFAGILGWFLYKKGGPFFSNRTAEIQRGIAAATEIRKEAEARYAEMEQRLAGLGAEIENLRRRAREESAAEQERLRSETERDLKRIFTQGEVEIAAAAKGARQELRAFAADLAVRLAEQRIRQRMSADVEARLVGSSIQQLASAAGQQRSVEAL